MVDELYKLLTTFTEESQKAIFAKVAELNLNPSSGVVPLDESFINLNSCRDLLIDAIENRKLIQLPVTVQQTLLKNLTEISRAQSSLLAGSDEIANLTAAIEQLNTAVWTYGLHNLSPEVLGYQQKLNQLKNQELHATNLQSELEKGLALKSKLEAVLATSESSVSKLQEAEKTASETLQRTTESGQQVASTEQSIKTTLTNVEQLASAAVTGIEQKTTSIVENIQRSDSSAAQLLASTKTANAEVAAVQPKIVLLLRAGEMKWRASGPFGFAQASSSAWGWRRAGANLCRPRGTRILIERRPTVETVGYLISSRWAGLVPWRLQRLTRNQESH